MESRSRPDASDYADVDEIIDRWVKTVGSVLCTGTADSPRRYFHMPGDPPFECFQISIRLPEDGQVSVTAAAIDTNDDTDDELVRTLEGPVSGLDDMLREAIGTIEAWKVRVREKPDPPSPW